jgi:hypothetical protein
MYVAFLREIKGQRAFSIIPCGLKVRDNIAEKWERSKNTDFLPISD